MKMYTKKDGVEFMTSDHQRKFVFIVTFVGHVVPLRCWFAVQADNIVVFYLYNRMNIKSNKIYVAET